MKKARILCLSLLCMVLLCACGNDDAAHTAVSEPASSVKYPDEEDKRFYDQRFYSILR